MVLARRAACFIVVLVAWSAAARAQGSDPSRKTHPVVLTKVNDSLIDPAALTIRGSFGRAINGKAFQQDAVVSHKGWQYAAYYDGKRHVCMARRRLPNGAWAVARFTDYTFQSNDAHNIISMGICPKDGTIHLAFDHHGHPLKYRVSTKGVASKPEEVEWTPALFGPIRAELKKGQPIRLTYPRFLQTPDGGLQFFYRRGGSGNGDRMLVDYDPKTGLWNHTRQIDSGRGNYRGSPSRCSYPNGYTYGPDGRLHVTWVWREGAQTANHDLAYAVSEDHGRTWQNSSGLPIDGPPRVDSPGLTVVEIGPDLGLMNTHGQAVDSRGRVHTVLWHSTAKTIQAAGSKPGMSRWGPPAARRHHHYWRAANGRWQHRQLAWFGGRPKIFADRHDNLLLIYGRGGRLEIAAASAASKWTDWSVVHVEKGPFVNEMLGDPYRWQAEGVLSILVQGVPKMPHDPTPLRVISFEVKVKSEPSR
jgi:hypothetical protein